MTTRTIRTLVLICLAAGFLLAALAAPGPWSNGIAWADDDDGGDDDGGDDDGGDDDGGSDDDRDDARSRFDDDAPTRRVGRPPAPRRTVAVAPRPDFVPEIVVAGLAAADLVALQQEGFTLIESLVLADAGTEIVRLAPPAGLTLAAARARVRLVPGGSGADFNHLYRTSQDVVPTSSDAPVRDGDCRHANCGAHELVNWPDAAWRDRNCPIPAEIGIIDTGVNKNHDLLDSDRLEVVRLSAVTADPSGQIHGTAVVSVLAGQTGSRVEGLLPEARYVVADVFGNVAGDERADAFSLIRGLDLLAARQVRVVNLSLAGPDNATLAAYVDRLVTDRKMILVAAVGNGGPDRDVAFPAAYPGVIAVTATDRRGRIYRSAQRGEQVDLAAPGAGLLVATSVRGARERSGTSFATPYVTAAAALLVAGDPTMDAERLRSVLAATARDLGDTGPDPVYGHGILQADAVCRPGD